MKCRTKKSCPLCNPKNLMIAGICAAAAVAAVLMAAVGYLVRRRKKARLEPIIFEPPVQPAENKDAPKSEERPAAE